MYDVALTCVIHDALNESSDYIRRYFPIISNIYNFMYTVEAPKLMKMSFQLFRFKRA